MSRLGTWFGVVAACSIACSADGAIGGEIEVSGSGSKFDVKVDGQPFTALRADLGPKPILFPIVGPTGKAMTRSYPMEDVAGEKKDHPHHRSLWFTHGDVNGIDFWSENKGHGRIEQIEAKLAEGNGPQSIVERCRWIGPDDAVVLEDERTITFLADRDARMIDFDITLKALDKPVKFGDTKEGTFGLRVPSAIDVDKKAGGKITNSDGKTDAAAWGQPAKWVDYSGVVDGEKVGVCVMNHPSSYRYPTTWHVRTYGLFAANPFGLGSFPSKLKEDGSVTLAPGKSLTLRYRVLLHKGDASEVNLAEAFDMYRAVEKPAVEQPE